MTVSCDQSSIVSTYYESMRDNFEGYAWEIDPANPLAAQINQQKVDQLKVIRDEFQAMDPLKGERPSLGQLFKIEVDLVSLIPEVALRERFWTIEDRFCRVVPKGVATAYLASLDSTAVKALPEAVLRQRARTLLDTIHSNYHVNFAREILIRRLMFVLATLAFVLLAIAAMTTRYTLPPEAQQGLLLITVVGMAGAIISTIQRLQKATSRDAMVDDGIFELISLRIGWLSILMSVGIGGVSALFIYALVSAGLLDSVVPQIAAEPGSPIPPSAPNGLAASLPVTPVCAAGQDCLHWADKIYPALALEERSDLFKLTVYAFAAGFAERFVPDTINKLAKDVIPAASPAGK